MIFSEFLKVRDELAQIALDNNSRVAALLTDGETVCEAFSTQIIGTPISFSNGTLTVGDDTFSSTGITEHLADVITGDGLTLSDYLETMSSSGDSYSLLGSITSKFSYSNRVSLSDLTAMIDSVVTQQSLNYDISSLKDQLLAVSDNDGYVTSKSWLLSLKDWMNSCKNGTDNQSPDLDNTAPNALASLYTIVTTTVTVILTAIFTALGAIFGVIIGLIGSLLSNLFQAISNYFQNSGSIDVTAPNSFTKGVIISREMSRTVYHDLANLTAIDSSINYCECPTIGFFFWQGSTQFRMRTNAYLTPKYSFKGLRDCILDIADIEEHDPGTANLFPFDINIGSGTVIIQKNANRHSCFDYMESNYDQYETDEYRSEVTSVFEEYAKSLAACEFYRILNAGYDYRYVSLTATSPYWSSNSKILLSVAGFCLLAGEIGYNDCYHFISFAKLCEIITNYQNTLYEISGELDLDNAVRYQYSEEVYGIRFDVPINPFFCYDLNSFTTNQIGRYVGAGSLFSNDELYTVCQLTAYNSIKYSKANCLPCSFFAEFNGVSFNQALTLFILTSIAAISAAVIYTKVAKAIRIKKIEKQTLRTRELSAKKAAFEADPTNMTLLNDYAQSVDKYNRIGRILHWGSYDAANGWVNSYSNANSNVSTTVQSKSILSKTLDSIQAISGVSGQVAALPSDSDIIDPLKAFITQEIKKVLDLIH